MTVKTKTRAKPHAQQVKKLTPKERLEDLRIVVDLCFTLFETDDLKEISNMTGLCVSTIWRFQNGEFSLFSRIDTLQRLCAAAGLKLSTTEYETEVRLIG